MKLTRLAVIVGLLAIAGALFAQPASGAPASNWRALNEALAPVNIALRADVGAFGQTLGKAGGEGYTVFSNAPLRFSATRKAIKALTQDMDTIQQQLRDIREDAGKGIKVLDSFAPEKCSAHFVAVQYAVFSTWYETATELLAEEPPVAANAAIYLGGFSPIDLQPIIGNGPLDDEWDAADCKGKVESTPVPTVQHTGTPKP